MGRNFSFFGIFEILCVEILGFLCCCVGWFVGIGKFLDAFRPPVEFLIGFAEF